MDIHQERRERHSIEAYSETEVKINQTLYHNSLIVSADTLITSWSIGREHPLTEMALQPLLALEPEIILIGSPTPCLIAPALRATYAVESMSLGAACRTFNILLSESRRVVLGLIL